MARTKSATFVGDHSEKDDLFSWFRDIKITPRYEDQERISHFEKWVGPKTTNPQVLNYPMARFLEFDTDTSDSPTQSTMSTSSASALSNQEKETRDDFDGLVQNEDDDDRDPSPGTPNSEHSLLSQFSSFSSIILNFDIDSDYGQSDIVTDDGQPWEDFDENEDMYSPPPIPSKKGSSSRKTDQRKNHSVSSWCTSVAETVSDIPDALSAFIIESSAELGARVKQSLIPDAMSYFATNLLSLSYLLDEKLDIYNKGVHCVVWFIRVWIWVWTVMVTASIRFFVAYQNAPSLERQPNQLPIVPNENMHRRNKGKDNMEPPPSARLGSSENSLIRTVTPIASTILKWIPTLGLSNLARRNSIVENSNHFLPVDAIQLSVGGFPFSTTAQTLQKFPESYLSNISKKFNRHHRHSVLFIDRDGTHFRHILNYLRGTDSMTGIEDRATLFEILRESEFYEIPTLSMALKRRLGIADSPRRPTRNPLSMTLKRVAKSIFG